MKHTIEFTLPEEEDELRLAINATRLSCCLDEIKNKLRTWVKHGHEFQSADDALQAAYDALWESANDNGIGDLL